MGRKTLMSLSIVSVLAVAGASVPAASAQKVAPKIGSSKLSAKGKVTLMFVPAGEFTMGSDGGESFEKPEHKVNLDAYWIGKTDVTVAQFRAYCQAAGYAYDWKAHEPNWGWVDSHPMVNVTWIEARSFCIWVCGDLPTEAQWEKAARGTDARVYPWGDTWDASKCAGNLYGTKPVGSYPAGASPYGCLDMAGNVSQWCRDRWAAGYDAGTVRNPTGPSSGDLRVRRGGSWTNMTMWDFRCWSRAGYDPTLRFNDCGFRTCCGT